MSVSRAKQEIPSAEFVAWTHFLEDEIFEQTRMDFFLARLTAEVVRNRQKTLKGLRSVKDADYLHPIKRKAKKKSIPGIDSKSIWIRAVGLKPPKGDKK